MLALANDKQHIDVVFEHVTEQQKKDNRIRLNGSIDAVRLCVREGLALRGH